MTEHTRDSEFQQAVTLAKKGEKEPAKTGAEDKICSCPDKERKDAEEKQDKKEEKEIYSSPVSFSGSSGSSSSTSSRTCSALFSLI